MPNWTFNEVKCKGIANAPLYDEKGDFDFNKLVAEPQTMEECIAKYGERFIDHGNNHLCHEDGDDWFNWYKWRYEFWGVKWNASDTGRYYDADTICFYTPWEEPKPIWKALSEMFPDEIITIRTEYDDGIFTNSEWLDGEEMFFESYEMDWEDYVDYVEAV